MYYIRRRFCRGRAQMVTFWRERYAPPINPASLRVCHRASIPQGKQETKHQTVLCSSKDLVPLCTRRVRAGVEAVYLIVNLKHVDNCQLVTQKNGDNCLIPRNWYEVVINFVALKKGGSWYGWYFINFSIPQMGDNWYAWLSIYQLIHIQYIHLTRHFVVEFREVLARAAIFNYINNRKPTHHTAAYYCYHWYHTVL